MKITIALAGNPNCGKTTLFNALTGSNQFVGNWPGVTVEKKEGKLKKHNDVVITDLPGIYSLSPYTLEEVVARDYLIGERPNAILNIIDGTNLERNLYLTTQLVELGIPVVVAINMMDVVKKNGDKINTQELSRELGCPVVEISALKGTGIQEAAEAAVQAAQNGHTVPQHTFTGVVEHALAHIEEAAVHNLPEEQQRWYAIKIFERDDKVLAKMDLDAQVAAHIEEDIKAAEEELDDDAESIITNERYVYIASIIKGCYKKKQVGKLSTSDKIDKIVTNRWLGLPIFAVVMFLVYYISMVTVGSSATDWANDGVFGDGWHLFWIGTSQAADAEKTYGDTDDILAGFIDAYGTEDMANAIDTENENYSDANAKAALAQLVAATPRMRKRWRKRTTPAPKKLPWKRPLPTMRTPIIKRAMVRRTLPSTAFGCPVSRFCWVTCWRRPILPNGCPVCCWTVLSPVLAPCWALYLKCWCCSSCWRSWKAAVI